MRARMNMEEDVWVVGFDSAGCSSAVTCCARKNAHIYARDYRSVGYPSVRTLNEEQFNEVMEREHAEFMRHLFD